MTNLVILSIKLLTNSTPERFESLPCPDSFVGCTVAHGTWTKAKTNIVQITSVGFVSGGKTNRCGELRFELEPKPERE